jgi:hypothetical protein
VPPYLEEDAFRSGAAREKSSRSVIRFGVGCAGPRKSRALGSAQEGVEMESVSRRKLLAVAGAATGTAAVAAAPRAAAAALDRGEVTDPSGPLPEEVVVAVVRDAKRGEVTVMAGEREVTYRDPSLVKRLMKAAPKSKE